MERNEELDEQQQPGDDEGDEPQVEAEEEEERIEAQPQPTPAKTTPKRRSPRSDIGKPHAPPRKPWSIYREAELMWQDMVQKLPSEGKTAHDVFIQAVRTEPPPLMPVGEQIDGSMVVGDSSRSASRALIEAIDEYVHLPTARTAAKYNIRFFWKQNGNMIGTGWLRRPPPAEIIAGRNAAARMHQAQPQGVGYAPPPQMTQGYQPQPSYYGYPPPQGGGDDAEMRAELARLRERESYYKGTLDEVLRAQREGREARINRPPAGVGAVAPPAAPIDEDRLADRVTMSVLRALGVRPGQTPGVGLGAPPAAATPKSTASAMEEGVAAFESTINNAIRLEGVAKRFLHRNEKPAATPEPTVVAQPEAEEKPDLPFDVIEIPDTDFGGQTAKITLDKETGEIDWKGALFANPRAAEKIIDGATTLAKGLGRFLQNVATATTKGNGVAEVVDRIPAGAVNAGVGETPANGAARSDGGWPSS